jgi:chitinase
MPHLDAISTRRWVGELAMILGLLVAVVVPGSLRAVAASHTRPLHVTPAQRAVPVKNPAVVLRAERLTRELRTLVALRRSARRGRAAVSRRLVAVSRARQRALARLLAQDPQAARATVLPAKTRRVLSKVPGARVETQVRLEGRYRIWHQDNFKDPSRDQYVDQLVTPNGKRIFTLHGATSGLSVGLTFAHLKPNVGMSLRGYLVGKQLLVTGMRTLRLRRFQPSSTSSSSASTVGAITTAVIAVNFSDSATPVDMNAIRANFLGNPGHDVDSYFDEASYGKASIVPTFFGPYTLSQSTAAGCNDPNLTQSVLNAANADANYTLFRRLVYVVNCPGVVGTSTNEAPVSTPDGTVTAAQIQLGPDYATKLYYVVHELAHTLGSFNHHSNYFDCLPDAFTSPDRFDQGCDSAEYGDEFDVLGGGVLKQTSQLDPFHKANAGWFTAAQYPTVSSPGTYTYTLAPYELASAGPLALNIPRGQSGTSFTVEYRQPIGFDSWMGSSTSCPGCTATQGASIRLSNYYVAGGGGGGDTQLIDTTPGSVLSSAYYPIEDGRDGMLLPGKTFTDPEYGISISVQSADALGMTVQVTVPAQPCTHAAPSVVAAGSTSATATPGQTATYTYTLTNNDSSGCHPNTFRYFPDLNYPDVTAVASPDWVSLAPGASTTVKLAVTSSPTTLAGTYYFRGQFLGNSLDAGGTTLPSATYQVTSAADTASPTAPTNVTARALGSNTVALSWTPSTDNVAVMGYSIQRSDGFSFESQSASFTDTTALPNTSYSYSVQAFDRKNNLSPAASVSAATPAKTDFTAPSAPVVTATANDHSITVSWAPSTDNNGVAYYSVRPCLVAGCSVPASQTSFTVQGLPTRTRYDLQILAYDRDGNYSNWGLGRFTVYTAAAGTSAPSQPTQLMSTAGAAGRIDLSWHASTDDKGVAGYDIYRDNRKLTTVTGTSFSDTHVAGNSEYYVQAVDTDGSLSAPSARVWFLIPAAAGSDTTPPTAQITDSGGATLSGTTTISATASDDVGVTSVELYVDGVRQATDTAAPYTFSWDTTGVANGSHWIYVKANDAAGNYGGSSVTTVSVNNGGPMPDTTAPTVALTAPANGATVSGTVAVSASASDDVGVDRVEFSVDGAPLGVAMNAPYTASWNASAAGAGSHTLTARAYDAAGNSSSSSITVTASAQADTAPPTVSIASPANGAVVTGTVQVTASASDNVGVAKVDFSVDGTLSGTVTAAPYTFGIDTTGLPAGNHTLSAKAYDAAGNSSSAQVTVNVQGAGGDTSAPSKPSSVRAAVVGTTQVALQWAPSTDNVGVAGYDVYRDGTLLAQTTLPNYLDSGLAPATSHVYYVRARDAAGNTSAASSNLSTKTAATSTSTTGTIAGVVYNALGRPASNVVVQLTGNGVTKSTKTNSTGVYKFSSLLPGDYSLTIALTASAPGSTAPVSSTDPATSATVVSGQTIVLVDS